MNLLHVGAGDLFNAQATEFGIVPLDVEIGGAALLALSRIGSGW